MLRSICIVCWANICRSPVAEFYIREKLNSNYKVTSAGINPNYIGGMDKRSFNFLSKKYPDITNNHVQKKISTSIINENDLILAMDIIVLMHLNKTFKKHSDKFKMFNYQFPEINTNDPYRSNDEEYFQIMSNIEFISKNMNI